MFFPSNGSRLVLRIHFAVRSLPALLRPLERVITLVGLNPPWGVVTQPDQILLDCLIVECVDLLPIDFLNLSIRFLQAYQVNWDGRLSTLMGRFPDCDCILLCRWIRLMFAGLGLNQTASPDA